VFEADEEATVASVNMNLLPTAGSSIIHPHVQAIVDDRGTTSQQARLDGAREFTQETGEAYFDSLLAVSRDTDRYVGSVGAVEWIAPFAPRHHRHIRGIAPEPGLLSTDATAVDSIGTGISNVLSHYADIGLNSFNFGLHVFDDESIRPHVDIVARSVFEEYAWSDATFFETIHDESVIDVPPESYGTAVAERF
ncbi:MAG: hypothetical protein ACOCTH_01215, partial [Halodesulfurarchaeum sp.]